MRLRLSAAVVVSAMSLTPVSAQEAVDQRDQAVFFFGGRFTDQYFEYSFAPFTVSYEDNYVVGAGYQEFFLGNRGGLMLGAELGVAGRFGDRTSTELWGGVVARADNLLATQDFGVSFSLTTGLSVASDTIGIESPRELESGGDTTLLFYLGPEVSVNVAQLPDTEFFWRIHHRSGAWKTLGGMQDGANATVLGVRWKF
ncbi:MAG TPA: hypothetical protein VGN79_10365 [Devosia sp.]|jgi:hypothetical protein|nr:hypothetical protein [Devosia sp.]